EHLLNSAATEAKNLMQYHNGNHNLALQAIKYSFADYGNLVKGDDMDKKDNITTKMNDTISKIKTDNNSASVGVGTPLASTATSFNRKDWWDKNKKKVWNVMLCQYTGTDKTEHCNEYNTIDKIPQFLRWLEEWARKYCSERTKLANMVTKECKMDIQKIDLNSPDKNNKNCITSLNLYKTFFHNRHLEWDKLKKKYKKDKEKNSSGNPGNSNSNSYTEKDAEAYLKKNCKECVCTYDDLKDIYDKGYKTKEIVPLLSTTAKYDTDPEKAKIKKILTMDGLGPKIVTKAIEAANDIIPDAAKAAKGLAKDVGIPAATTAARNVFSGLRSVINWFSGSSSSQQPQQTQAPNHSGSSSTGNQNPGSPRVDQGASGSPSGGAAAQPGPQAASQGTSSPGGPSQVSP
ncbi:putative EMP1-like protein, partial [Plasmodium gaboni]